jgi:hypothetical protein
MKKSLLFSILFFSVLLFIFGCAANTKLADYQPKSTEETEILNFIIECDKAYQNENFTKWLACFHDDAKIRIWQTDLVTIKVVSKAEYKEYLEAMGTTDMESEIINPKITITGDRATIKYMDGASGYIRGTFDLMRESESWSITRWYWSM